MVGILNRVVVTRAEKEGLLERLCRGIYRYPAAAQDDGFAALPCLAPLRAVLEKERLHQDLPREMAEAGLLHRLTFIGGTCLRACYGSHRLSEDLDFTGGADVDPTTLGGLGPLLIFPM
jgi:hypothetical protein